MGIFFIIIAIVVLTAWIASISMLISVIKAKGSRFDSTLIYWFVGLFASPIVLGLYAIALPAKDKKHLCAESQYRVSVKLKEGDEEQREYWTCPECGKSWYIKNGAIKSAFCGNDECGIKVMLDR